MNKPILTTKNSLNRALLKLPQLNATSIFTKNLFNKGKDLTVEYKLLSTRKV